MMNRFPSVCTSFRRIYSKYLNYVKVISNKHAYRTLVQLQLYTTLAFVWPVKKKKEEIEDVGTSQIILLERADYLFDNGSYDECYKLLTSSEVVKDVETLWRTCRVLYNMSKDPKYNKTHKKELVLQAYAIIEDLLENHTNHSAVQKWYAILLNSKTSYEGIKERIKQLEKIKKHMDLAVMLDPSDATTLYMLGEWCYQVAGLPWYQRKIAETIFASPPRATYEEALEYFLKAETVRPRFYSLNLLRLGECYSKLNKDDQAKYYLKLTLSYPSKTNDDYQAQKEAAELLKAYKM